MPPYMFAELERRIAELEGILAEMRGSFGYRLASRLKRWRNRLLFLSATHELRPTRVGTNRTSTPSAE